MNNKNLVTKSNDIVEARYKLTSYEQKIIEIMVSMIQPDDEDFKPYRIGIADFLKLLKIKNEGAYNEIEKITKKLLEKVLVIYKPKSKLQINWMSSVEYYHGKGYVELEFSPKLKPYLLQLKKCFVSYRLNNVVQLKSSYAIRIYQLLKQYEKIGSRKFDLDSLREILGIKLGEYELYGHFKNKVLLPAQKQLKEHTDIKFSFKEIKTSRKITGIEFFINSNLIKEEFENKKLNLFNMDDSINYLLDMVHKDHRDKKTIIEAIAKAYNKHGYIYTARNVQYTNKNCSGNYRAYFNKSLKEDWGLSLQEDEEAEKRIIEDNKLRAMIEADKQKKEKELSEKVQSYIKNLSPIELNDLKKQAFEKLTPDVQDKFNENDPMYRVSLKMAMESIVKVKLMTNQEPTKQEEGTTFEVDLTDIFDSYDPE